MSGEEPTDSADASAPNIGFPDDIIPEWVPSTVRTEITERRDFFLAWFRRCQRIDGAVETATSDDASHYERLLTTIEHVATDERMKDVWKVLQLEWSDAQMLATFANCAWASNFASSDRYSHRSSRKSSAKRLASEIAKKANALAKLVREFREIAGTDADELLSTRSILDAATSDDPEWQAFKESLIHRRTGAEGHSARRAWEVSPGFEACLDVLASKAPDFTIQTYDPIGVAIDVRQFDPASAYLRTFAFLVRSNGIERSSALEEAMTTTAWVVLEGAGVLSHSSIVEKSQVQRALKGIDRLFVGNTPTTDGQAVAQGHRPITEGDLAQNGLFLLRKLQSNGFPIPPEYAALEPLLMHLSKTLEG